MRRILAAAVIAASFSLSGCIPSSTEGSNVPESATMTTTATSSFEIHDLQVDVPVSMGLGRVTPVREVRFSLVGKVEATVPAVLAIGTGRYRLDIPLRSGPSVFAMDVTGAEGDAVVLTIIGGDTSQMTITGVDVTTG